MRSSSGSGALAPWRRAAAALAAVVLSGAAGATTVSVLNNGSFEGTFRNGTYCSPLNGDTTAGNWAYGDAACSVLATTSITPLDGLRMLDFLPVPVGNISADVYQIVDLAPYADAVLAGRVTVDTEAYFNATVASRVGMGLFFRAATGPLTRLAGAYDEFATDADRSSWQAFGHTGIEVPTNARYLYFGLNTPAAYTPFAFADRASMRLHIADGGTGALPAPGTGALLAVAGLGLAATRRRRRRAG